MVNPAAHRPRFLAPGDKLGKYDLIRQIAVGGMAELYLARTVGIEGFEKLVVVKRILPQFASNASFVNMFLNEARLAATLHHPNIAQVYDIGQENTEYFFAMEYIHGEDLGRMTATATDSGVPISLDVSLTLVAGLCAGLHYAHDKVGSDGKPLNVVHRDVSPSNVLVSYDGAVKLVDFGIARAGSQPSTTRGGLKGKIGYMSPEQCKGRESLDRRSDIFSIGALLYELTCGRLPFVDETEYGVLNQIVNTDVQPPSQLVPSYPLALERIVLKALARDRDQRYGKALELQGDIEDFAHENRLRVSPLVLARLMGSLFPERLEEWDSARAQGAFFVEQHVVRTLIESGKSGDSGVAEAVPNGKTMVDEDTSISPPPAMVGDNEPTNIQNPYEMARGRTPVPRAKTPSAVTPLPPPPMPELPPTAPFPVTPRPPTNRGTPVPVTQRALTPTPVTPAPLPPTPQPGGHRIMSPVPGMPGAVPIVNPLAAKSGSLVSSAGVYGAPPTPIPVPTTAMLQVGDTTERVRVPSSPAIAHSDTSLLAAQQPRSRLPIVLLAAAGAIGVIVATVIVMSGGGAPSTPASPAKIEMKAQPAPVAETKPDEPAVVAPAETKPVEPAPVEPTPVEAKVEPVVEPKAEPKVEPKAEPKVEPKAEPKVVKVEPKPKKSPPVAKVEAKKKPPKAEPKVVKAEPKPEPKPEPKSEPKEPAKWNTDSPFMPVRPADKK